MAVVIKATILKYLGLKVRFYEVFEIESAFLEVEENLGQMGVAEWWVLRIVLCESLMSRKEKLSWDFMRTL